MIHSEALIKRLASWNPNQGRYDPIMLYGLIFHHMLGGNPKSIGKGFGYYIIHHPSSACLHVWCFIWFKHCLGFWFKSIGVGRNIGSYVLIHYGLILFHVNRVPWLQYMWKPELVPYSWLWSTVDFLVKLLDQSQPSISKPFDNKSRQSLIFLPILFFLQSTFKYNPHFFKYF